MKTSKEMIFGFYALLVIILGVIGFFVGKKNNMSAMYTIVGVVIGILISIILWFTVGKNMVNV